MTSVLIATPYFPPERGAPQQRWSELADLLADAGLAVRVVTNCPHYPSGSTYQGYRWRPWSRDSFRNVPVLRVGNIQAPHRGLVARLVDQLSSCISLSVGVLALPRADWVLLEVPPLFSILPLLAAKARRARVGVYVADLWPQSPIDLGVVGENSFAAYAMRCISLSIYRLADLVMTTSQAQFSHCAPLTNGSCLFLPSAVDLRRFPRREFVIDRPVISSSSSNREGVTRFVYVGTVGMAHGLDWLVRIVGSYKIPMQLRIFGDGAERESVRNLVSATGLGHVQVLDPVTSDEIPSLLLSSDIGVVSVKKGARALQGVLPSKLFEYMAAALPVLVIAVGEVADLVRGCGNGLVVEPGDEEGLVRALRRLCALSLTERKAMGRRGRELVEREYSRNMVSEKLIRSLASSYNGRS